MPVLRAEWNESPGPGFHLPWSADDYALVKNDYLADAEKVVEACASGALVWASRSWPTRDTRRGWEGRARPSLVPSGLVFEAVALGAVSTERLLWKNASYVRRDGEKSPLSGAAAEWRAFIGGRCWSEPTVSAVAFGLAELWPAPGSTFTRDRVEIAAKAQPWFGTDRPVTTDEIWEALLELEREGFLLRSRAGLAGCLLPNGNTSFYPTIPV